MDIIKDPYSGLDKFDDADGIWEALTGFLDTPGLIKVDEFFQGNSYLFDKAVGNPNNAIAFLIKLIRIGSHEQRIKLIDGILQNGAFIYQRTTKRLSDVLKQVGDMEVFDKFAKSDSDSENF